MKANKDSMTKLQALLENMACEGLPFEVVMKDYAALASELLSTQAKLAISTKSHTDSFLVWDGEDVLESPATSLDELESYLHGQRGKVRLYLGQDADGTPTENKLSVQKRMLDYCRIERRNEKITIENAETGIAVSSRRVSKDLSVAENIPVLLAQNPLWQVRQSASKNRTCDEKQLSDNTKCEHESISVPSPKPTRRRMKSIDEPSKQTSTQEKTDKPKPSGGRKKRSESNADYQPSTVTTTSSKRISKKRGLEGSDDSDILSKDGAGSSQSVGPENGKDASAGLANSLDHVQHAKEDNNNSTRRKDQPGKLFPLEKLAPINMDDLLTSPDSQLFDLDLRDILTLHAFVEDLDSADRASLYELLPEVDTRTAADVALLFHANMQFLSALSLYKRLLGSGAYDPALISKARNKRRRLDQWDDEKERAFNSFYGHRVDDRTISPEVISKWSALDEMVVEKVKPTKTTDVHTVL